MNYPFLPPCSFSSIPNFFVVPSSLQLVGSPTAEEVTFIANEGARKFILDDIPVFERQPLQQIFPRLSPEGADLAQRMLVFDPRKRITGETRS